MPTLTPEQQQAIQSYLARQAGQRTQAPPSFMGAMRDPEFWKRDVLPRASQVAQGGAAGILGAPVDIASAAMRPFGLAPAAEQTVGSSDWFGKLMGADPSSAPFVAGSIGVPDPTDLAKVAAKFDPATISAIMAGIPVFHGSPHKFEAFDLSKIGTGEGAQAYGHGLYFAESPTVAGTYRMGTIGANVAGDVPSAVQTKLDAAMHHSGGDMARAKDWLLKQQKILSRPQRSIIDQQNNDYYLASTKRAIDELDAGRVSLKEAPGALYHVDIPDEAIEKMLDWDKPLSEQPASVNAALAKLVAGDDPDLQALFADGISWEHLGLLSDRGPGAQIYKTLAAEYGGEAALSKKLNELGIPGIRYLDAGSRSTKEGTRNIVLFDDKLAKITKRE